MSKPEAILDAALELFEERGYGATPVPLLAQRAGVAAGTIYRYFPGKEGVVNALYQRWKAQLADDVLAALISGDDLEESFIHAWTAVCRFITEHPTAFAFLETHQHSPYLDDASCAASNDLDAALVNFVDRAQSVGLVRAGEPALLVAQVYGGLVGVVRTLRALNRPIPRDLAERTMSSAWSLLTGLELAPDANTQGETT